jgi:aryl-alcohol dehydrogenase-like predicted oxidoreductase
MEYVALGRTSLRVSRICLGCATFGGYDYGPADDDASVAAVRKAVDLGVNFFDVADVYGFGRAESILRQALGSTLRDIVVATKFGVGWTDQGRTFKDLSPTRLRGALEASLRRLGLDAIPLYQIHWPDGTTRWEDCMAALERCRDEGKVLHVGACHLSGDDLAACQRAGRVESLQMPFSMAEQQHADIMRAARDRHGMTTMAYNALAHGIFSGKHSRDAVFAGTDLRGRVPLLHGRERELLFDRLDRIKAVAMQTGRSCVQVALAWVLAQREASVVIVGTRTAAQIEESVGALDALVTEDIRS